MRAHLKLLVGSAQGFGTFMREWSVEDLTRWGNEIRDNELSFVSQCEMVEYSQDLMTLYNAAVDEIQRLRSLWLLVYTPLTQLIKLVHALDEGVVDEMVLVNAVKFYMHGIEGELNG